MLEASNSTVAEETLTPIAREILKELNVVIEKSNDGFSLNRSITLVSVYKDENNKKKEKSYPFINFYDAAQSLANTYEDGRVWKMNTSGCDFRTARVFHIQDKNKKSDQYWIDLMDHK